MLGIIIGLVVCAGLAFIVAAWALLDDGEGRCEVCGGRYLRVKDKSGKRRWVCRECGHEWEP